jgi:hypothetical protein
MDFLNQTNINRDQTVDVGGHVYPKEVQLGLYPAILEDHPL